MYISKEIISKVIHKIIMMITYHISIKFNIINNNMKQIRLMVAYLPDSMMATVTRIEGYVSWGVYNLFLTPAHDWIHNCIQD